MVNIDKIVALELSEESSFGKYSNDLIFICLVGAIMLTLGFCIIVLFIKPREAMC